MKTKQKMRFAFYVSGNASRLQKLIEKNSIILEDTVLVINDNAPHSFLKTFLSGKKIPYVEINYEKLGLTAHEKNIYLSKLLLEKLKEHMADYCFCFGSKILKGRILNEYKHKIINFHPSLLPVFPGEKSIDQALRARAFLLGNTAHFIDEGTDTGPVIMQSCLHRNTYKTYDSVLDVQIPMIEQICRWLVEKRLTVNNSIVYIRDADYSPIAFFPAVEH